MMGSQAERKKVVLTKTDDETDFYQAIMEHKDTLIPYSLQLLAEPIGCPGSGAGDDVQSMGQASTLKERKAFKARIIRA